jgi:hypothetical protein
LLGNYIAEQWDQARQKFVLNNELQLEIVVEVITEDAPSYTP